MRVYRFLLLGLVVGLLAACGGSGRSVASSTPAPSLPATESPSAAASPSPIASGAATDVPFPDGTPTAALPGRPCEPRTDYSPNSGAPGGNYIRAVTRSTRNWGPGCEVLSPGDRCEVGWDGAYIVTTGANAFLTFQAWTKGQNKPFKELTVGPLPAEYQLRRVGFPVEIPRSAKEVAFRIVLRNDAKVPVAISDAFAYTLNCRPETG